ncbi:MAG: hypothetical protein JWL83_1275, partial [Actinomycetia bacterium]|nr:hypothetical protein [Actinomycetes bacterium]
EPWRVAFVGEQAAAYEREGSRTGCARSRMAPGVESPLRFVGQGVERVEVEPLGVKRVAAVAKGDAVAPERCPQAAHEHCNLVGCACRRRIAPQRFGDVVDRDRPGSAEGKHLRERSRFARAYRRGRHSLDLERPEHTHSQPRHTAVIAAARETRAMPPRNAKIRERLLAYAGTFPETWEDTPWEEDLVVKVGKKIFVFFGAPADDGSLSVGMKLPESRDEALAYGFASPMGYGLGKSGWITSRFERGDSPPVDLLEEWIEESYRAVAPKKLVKLLDAPA